MASEGLSLRQGVKPSRGEGVQAAVTPTCNPPTSAQKKLTLHLVDFQLCGQRAITRNSVEALGKNTYQNTYLLGNKFGINI